MSKKELDLSGFDEAMEENELDLSGFDEAVGEEPEDMSTLEAIIRGGAQGLTFDFGDEIAGAIQAGVGKFQGEEGSIGDLYRKYTDLQRKQMEQAANAVRMARLSPRVCIQRITNGADRSIRFEAENATDATVSPSPP